MKTVFASLAALLIAAPASSAWAGEGGLRTSVGLRAGYSMPLGDWGKSPVVPSIDMIGGSIAVEVDFDVAFGERWSLAVEGGYAAVNGSAWEDYAAQCGEELRISGSLMHCAVLLRPQLLMIGRSLLRLELGPALLFASGEEVFDGERYPYDFLGGMSFGGKAGLEYVYLVAENIGLSLRGAVLVFPSATDPASSPAGTITMVPLSAGLRIFL